MIKCDAVDNVPVGAVYITGGTGFVGRRLVKHWSGKAISPRIFVQTRHVAAAQKIFEGVANIHFVSRFADVISSETIDLVVNLAGAPIADKPWSVSRKQLLMDSRVALSRQLFDDIASTGLRIKTLIQASAVGIYGFEQPDIDTVCKESDPVGDGFAAELCAEWERACVASASHSFDRIVVIRLAVVLGKGGLMSKLLPVFRCGFGGPIGSGNQPFPWVHIDDVVGFVDFSAHNIGIEGSYNLVAPQYSLQHEFASSLARVLKRPSFCRVPAWFLRMIMGQLADELLLGGRFVSASKLIESGYMLKFSELNLALENSV